MPDSFVRIAKSPGILPGLSSLIFMRQHAILSVCRAIEIHIIVEDIVVILFQHLTRYEPCDHGVVDVQRRTAHVDQRFYRDQKTGERDRKVHRRQDDQGSEGCSATNACNAEGTDDHDQDQLHDEAPAQRINADRRRDHAGEHGRIDAGAAVLADRCAKGRGQVGNPVGYAQLLRLRLHVQRNRSRARTGRERKGQRREYLSYVLDRIESEQRDDDQVDDEHDDQGHVRCSHELDQLQDFIHVGGRHGFGDQGQDAVWRQPEHERDDPQHDGVNSFDHFPEGCGLLRLLAVDSENRHPDERGENDDGQRGRAACARHVGKRIRRHEFQNLLRNCLILNISQSLLELLPLRIFAVARFNVNGFQVKAEADSDTHSGCNRHGHQQHRNDRSAHLAEILSALQIHDSGDDRYHNERHDHHLQQADIAVARQVEPIGRLRNDGRVNTENQLQYDAKHNPESKSGKHAFCERNMLLLHPKQQSDESEHDDHIDDNP